MLVCGVRVCDNQVQRDTTCVSLIMAAASIVSRSDNICCDNTCGNSKATFLAYGFDYWGGSVDKFDKRRSRGHGCFIIAAGLFD